MTERPWKKSISLFLTAQTVSLFGSSIVQYAIIWYITLVTSSGRMLMLSTMCGFLPQIVVSLFAGVWIDRYDRKRLIILSDSLIALATLALAAVFFAGYKNVWPLFAALAIRSAGTGVQTPAVNAIIPQIVPIDRLMKINGINGALSSLIMFMSPAVSGAVLFFVSLEATLLIDVATAFAGVAITSAVYIKPYARNKGEENSHLREIKKGFDYLKSNSFIGRLLIFQIVVLILISPSVFLTPLLVSRVFGNDVWRLTASEMTYSLGMITGGLLIAYWGGFKKKLTTTMLAAGVYGTLMIGLGEAPVFWLYLVCNALIGITAPCYNAPVTVTIQEQVSPEMHGRIFSFMQIASSCALPFGMAFFGPLADIIPVRVILTVAGTAVVAVAIAAYMGSYLEKTPCRH